MLTNLEKTNILLKEYQALRDEILNSMTNRTSVLGFGLAAIGVIYTGTVRLAEKSEINLILWTSVLLVPLICLLIGFVWIGEYQRIQRAGAFIIGLEQKINTLAGDDLLCWEDEIRKKKMKISYSYWMILLFLFLISAFSSGLGLFNLTEDNWGWWTLAGSEAVIGGFFCFMYLKVERWRKTLSIYKDTIIVDLPSGRL